MQIPVLTNTTIRVQSIRSQNPAGYGGAIFSGSVINEQGNICDAKQTVVVKAPYSLLNRIRVELGQWWEIYGESQTYINEINGYKIKEIQLLPHQMQLIRPSGEHIIRLMADNKAFEGVGEVKARKLWEYFGNDLYAYLDKADISSLSKVVSTYRRFALGDTAVTLKAIQKSLIQLLQPHDENWAELTGKAMISGYSQDCYIIRDNGVDLVLHALGPYFMEKNIAGEVVKRMERPANGLSGQEITQELYQFEQQAGFILNTEQRNAVTVTISNTISIITGGAGTGKTTVLEALYRLYDKAGIEIYQMALSGRATKRMMEATGREGTTIAGFLRNVDTSGFNDHTVIVIDEASMIDVSIMHRVLQKIPDETRIVLVGDAGQLPPIGAGLVLHNLLEVKELPVTELKEVNRYGNKILNAAESIRNGHYPELSENINDDICFIPCKTSEIKEKLVSIYAQCLKNKIDVQILEPVKSGKYCGTERTNLACQEAFANKSRPLKLWNNEFDQFETLSFKEGEPVICTQNHWDKELQNGSLGKILEVYSEPREQFNSKNEPVGEAYADIEWDDGIIRPLTEDMIDDVILAYSITVHKGQGSQWDTIIVPVYQARNLDRSMLYTAITRAREKVILLGDLSEARKVTEEPPKVISRTTGLLDFINELYH